MLTTTEVAVRLALAGAIGLAVGTEREWSGPVSGPDRRFAGLRTFLLLGVLGGVSGLLGQNGQPLLAVVLVAGAVVLVLAEYFVGARRPGASLGSTTEAASLVVIGLGAIVSYGYLWPPAAVAAVIVFALGEKERLHWLVHRIGQAEMQAALRFLVLALVVLPILPDQPLFGLDSLRPRKVWMLVLIFSGIDFLGYLARHAAGAGRGMLLTGGLGGLASSTAVTLQLARGSLRHKVPARETTLGILAACIMVTPRVLVVAAVIDPAVAWGASGYFLLYLVLALLALRLLWVKNAALAPGEDEADTAVEHSPMRLGNAMMLAGIFALALASVDLIHNLWGEGGVLATATLLGAVKMDALAVAMARLAEGGELLSLAVNGLVLGLAINTLTKAGLVVIAGSHELRRQALPWIVGPVLPVLAVLWWKW